MTLKEIFETVRDREIGSYWGGWMSMCYAEECGESISALSKFSRGCASKQDLVDEFGDVIISMMAICDNFDISVENIEARILKKTQKEY